VVKLSMSKLEWEQECQSWSGSEHVRVVRVSMSVVRVSLLEL